MRTHRPLRSARLHRSSSRVNVGESEFVDTADAAASFEPDGSEVTNRQETGIRSRLDFDIVTSLFCRVKLKLSTRGVTSQLDSFYCVT